MIKGVKDTFVDVKAVLNDGSNVIIEMQVLNHKGFEKRVLYNAAKNYSVQLTRNEDYQLLNPVIALSIVDFNMFDDSAVINRFKLLEKEKLIHYSDDIELVFVELPKFNKTLDELTNIEQQWIYFLKNAGTLDFIPKNFDSSIQHALDVANEANMTPDELEAQHKRKEFISIQKGAVELAEENGLEKGMEKGLEKGLEQGMEKGIEQGIEKGVKQVAIKLLKANVAMDTIMLTTGLTEQVIEDLKIDLSI
jgi:predicted transposase/invertase (TIGR01784 family)